MAWRKRREIENILQNKQGGIFLEVNNLIFPQPSPQIILGSSNSHCSSCPSTRPPLLFLPPDVSKRHLKLSQWWVFNENQAHGRRGRDEEPRGRQCDCSPLPNLSDPDDAIWSPKCACPAHSHSVCFCLLRLKIASLWAERAPDFSICFEPTSAHLSCGQSCLHSTRLKESTPKKARPHGVASSVGVCWLVLWACSCSFRTLWSYQVLSVKFFKIKFDVLRIKVFLLSSNEWTCVWTEPRLCIWYSALPCTTDASHYWTVKELFRK